MLRFRAVAPSDGDPRAPLLALGDVLAGAHDLPWGLHLYVADEPWSTGTPCALFDLDDLDDAEDDPPAARRLGLVHVLDTGQVQDVLDNLRSQVAGEVSAELALAALLHHHDDDAFVDQRWLREHDPRGRRAR